MDNVKDKMYNYEVSPPRGVWETIASELDDTTATIVPIGKKRSRLFYYSLAAASVVIVLFCIIFFTNSNKKNNNEELVSSPSTTNQTNNSITKKDDIIITVPSQEKNNTAKNNNKDNFVVKSIPQKTNPSEIKNIAGTTKIDSSHQSANNKNPDYITIANPQGQSVKVSSKMASLMDSSNENSPSKPIWNKKISDWKEIMKANTLAPTPGNFLDIIELTKTVKDKK